MRIKTTRLLFQSAGRDHFSGVSAKGLSGEGYEGHFFWDIEIYIQPFFILNFPSIAKNLLSYGYRILDSAREHAKITGHSRGALYPWRTIMGSECSGYFPSGSAQYHINGAVALSVLYYFAGGIHVQVETGRSRFRLTSGMPAMIRVYGKEYELGDELVIEHLM